MTWDGNMKFGRSAVMLLCASLLLTSIAALGTTAAAGDNVGSPSMFQINSPGEGAYLNNKNVTVAWGVDVQADQYMVSLDDGEPVNVAMSTQYTLTYLTDGQHSVNVSSYASSALRLSDRVTFVVDTTAPSVTISNPSPGAWLNATTLNVTWTASDVTTGLKNVSVSMDGGAYSDNAAGYQEFTALAEGQHTVAVRAYDNADNVRVSTKVFHVDTGIPGVAITSPGAGEEVGDSVQVSWSGTAASGMGNYWIMVDNGPWIDVDLNTSYSLNDLAIGQHTVALKASSYAGNQNTTSVTFTVTAAQLDNVPPTVSGTPTGNAVALNSTVVATFSEVMDQGTVTFTVSGVQGAVTWNGNVATFTPSAALAFGTTYTVNVTGKDLAGNAVAQEWSFTTVQEGGSIIGTVRDVNGNFIPGATVSLSNGASTTTDADGKFTLSNVAPGEYTLNITKAGYPSITRSVETATGQTNDLGAMSLVSETPSTNNGGIDGNIILIAAGVLVAALVVFLLVAAKRLRK